MKRALGISVHTGWATCVVVSGTLRRPIVSARADIEMLGDTERFVFHRAATMKPRDASAFVARARTNAIANARAALAPFLSDVRACGIVAKLGDPGVLADILASHPRIHTAEGCFYRDVLLEVIDVPARVVPPAALDTKSARVSALGRIVGRPWANDHKLAALAAWRVLR